jgi:hypothetical protein
MRKYIDDDQIPPVYGGSSRCALGQRPYQTGCFDVAAEAGTYERQVARDEGFADTRGGRFLQDGSTKCLSTLFKSGVVFSIHDDQLHY